ncbi:hypothetical protein FRB95_003680 [Tulasnella sp. JGI-2019a]|nr:hypothetical protein FRB95_003680 [Tulasnella sp. JGI-2019a]
MLEFQTNIQTARQTLIAPLVAAVITAVASAPAQAQQWAFECLKDLPTTCHIITTIPVTCNLSIASASSFRTSSSSLDRAFSPLAVALDENMILERDMAIVHCEIEQYIRDGIVLDVRFDILKYWKACSTQYPLLYKITLDVPPSTGISSPM